MVAVRIPEKLAETCRGDVARQAWLDALPEAIHTLTERWSLRVGDPFEADATCAWVAPVVRSDGSAAVLKLGMPHMEGMHEIEGLRLWNGDPMVRLLDADDAANGMLLERCLPGTSLRGQPEAEQDDVIGRLLTRLWRSPPTGHPFRPLAHMATEWKRAAEMDPTRFSDAGLTRDAIAAFDELPRSAPVELLLATDLHAGNVLRAERQPWLAIDPKPFVGDPAYDVTQHLLNCPERLASDPIGLVDGMSERVAQDAGRIRRWLFARLVLSEARDEPARWLAAARALAR